MCVSFAVEFVLVHNTTLSVDQKAVVASSNLPAVTARQPGKEELQELRAEKSKLQEELRNVAEVAKGSLEASTP